ncbi:D-sedoheptulose-7-phosphate isomerase [Sphingomonas hengshuiensis]|uniref:Phosphoheptose isomerase n=1 Tax=Sphingomonas hengshuiensis TaxID=1609977 RepID=A0A7U5BGF1_9SPHN|nr:D-sedoheptulose 7-phosphate isomerase [Sphingomonas hengshuiensis]AJP74810.1 phosphoheptose isomerase [Sphingomonas hengshuiensis]
MSLFLANLAEHREVFARLDALSTIVAEASGAATASLRAGNKVMFCGNGGSAADSQHLAAELTGRFIKDRPPLAGLALNTDSSALTCIGNDYSFADVFVRQVRGLGRTGDCLVGISTSGNSANVLRAFEAAREMGITTIGFLGRDGGQIKALSDYAIIVPSDVTARIQEAHILIGHTLCGLVEQQLGLVEA